MDVTRQKEHWPWPDGSSFLACSCTICELSGSGPWAKRPRTLLVTCPGFGLSTVKPGGVWRNNSEGLSQLCSDVTFEQVNNYFSCLMQLSWSACRRNSGMNAVFWAGEGGGGREGVESWQGLGLWREPEPHWTGVLTAQARASSWNLLGPHALLPKGQPT